MKTYSLIALLCAITLGGMQSALAQLQGQSHSAPQNQGYDERHIQADGARSTSLAGAELVGKEVVSADGDVVGEVKEVTWSDKRGKAVALISRGGFLGMAESQIEVPVSELSMSGGYQVRISMTTDELDAIKTESSAVETQK